MRTRTQGFTLFEVILALGLLALLTGAVYSISSAALDASRSTLDEQFAVRRLESFLRVTRQAFLNLPREGTVFLRMTSSASGAPVPEMVFREAAGIFGVASLGGGSLILAARPRADGSRSFSMLRVPANMQGAELSRYSVDGPWVALLPGVERVKWTFFANGEWREEWPEGAGRPLAVRLEMECRDVPGYPVDVQFWIPPLAAAPPPQAGPTPETSPTPAPTP